jgi:hypothetical protein
MASPEGVNTIHFEKSHSAKGTMSGPGQHCFSESHSLNQATKERHDLLVVLTVSRRFRENRACQRQNLAEKTLSRFATNLLFIS